MIHHEDILRDVRIRYITDTEVVDSLKDLTQAEIVMQKKYVEKEMKRLRHYTKVIEWDLYQRALKILNEELIKHESQEGINDWLIK